MKIKNIQSFFSKFLCSLAITFFTVMTVNATVINFDSLDTEPHVDADGYWIPLSNELESEGILFSRMAFAMPWNNISTTASKPNYISGPWADITFIGELPVYVSMTVGNFSEAAVFLRATGPSGYLEDKRTRGFVTGMGVTPEDSTPYYPDQTVWFRFQEGISSISIDGQHGFYMDDLTFYFSGQAFPEPSTFLLLGVGVLGLFFNRKLKCASEK